MSPKSMLPAEKERMKNKFYEKGRELLLTLGVKKTSVEDITKAAGMSKGSFYLYFTSKEEFFFDIFEQFHEKLKQEAMEVIDCKSEVDLKTRLKQFLFKTFMDEKNAAFFLRSADLEYLLYKLPLEKMEAHKSEDNDMMLDLIKHAGIDVCEEDSLILSNMMKTIFLARCSVDMLNQKVMDKTVELLVETAVNYVFRAKGDSGNEPL